MSDRNSPHIVSHTFDRWVGISQARPGFLMITARVPTPESERRQWDQYRQWAWPNLALNNETAFKGELDGLVVWIAAVKGYPTEEWSITMRYGTLTESRAFRIEGGAVTWLADSRAAEVARFSLALAAA